MNNEITIDIEKVRNSPDNSIKDVETIRQIALYGIKTGDISLYSKVKKEMTFAGLYPEVINRLNVLPYKPKK